MHVVQVPFGNSRVTRMAPDLGPQFYKTYRMAAPLRTHWRKATCEEVGCLDFLNGFVLTIDIGTDLGARQMHYVMKEDRERSPKVQKVGPTLYKVYYGPGTPCFAPKRDTHVMRVDREPVFAVEGGDWRGNPRGTPRLIHHSGEDWVDDFANHQMRLAEISARG